MKWTVALCVVAAFAGCGKSNDKNAGGKGGDAAVARVADAAPAAPDAAPLPPDAQPAPPKPNSFDAIRRLTTLLQTIGEESGVAMMHGCAEGEDRFAELFEDAEESEQGRELKGWMADEQVRGEVRTAVDKGTDAALTEAMVKLHADATGCKGAPAILKKGLERLLTP